MTEDVRIIDSEIGPVIPINDVAQLIGYSRSAISKAIKRHDNRMRALTTFLPLPTSRGPQRFLCLNREGIDRLFMFIRPSATRMDDDRFLALHKSILDKMAARTGTLSPAASSADPDPAIACLKRNAEIADILVKGYGYTEAVAHRLAMQDAVNKHGEVLAPFKAPALLPAAETPETPMPYKLCQVCTVHDADPDFDRYFSGRKIAEIVHESEDRVRNILEKEGLLHYAHGIWHLTTLGQKFGKVFTYYPLWPHRATEKKMIRWSPAAIERVKVHLSAGQTSLVPAQG